MNDLYKLQYLTNWIHFSSEPFANQDNKFIIEKRKFLESIDMRRLKDYSILNMIINLILIYLLSDWAYSRSMKLKKKIRDEYYEMVGGEAGEVELTDEERQKEDEKLNEEMGGSLGSRGFLFCGD